MTRGFVQSKEACSFFAFCGEAEGCLTGRSGGSSFTSCISASPETSGCDGPACVSPGSVFTPGSIVSDLAVLGDPSGPPGLRLAVLLTTLSYTSRSFLPTKQTIRARISVSLSVKGSTLRRISKVDSSDCCPDFKLGLKSVLLAGLTSAVGRPHRFVCHAVSLLSGLQMYQQPYQTIAVLVRHKVILGRVEQARRQTTRMQRTLRVVSPFSGSIAVGRLTQKLVGRMSKMMAFGAGHLP